MPEPIAQGKVFSVNDYRTYRDFDGFSRTSAWRFLGPPLPSGRVEKNSFNTFELVLLAPLYVFLTAHWLTCLRSAAWLW